MTYGRELLVKKGKVLECLPTTIEVPIKHTLPASKITGHTWAQALVYL